MRLYDEEIELIIRKLIEETAENKTLPFDQFGKKDILTEVGLDSMDLVSLVVAIEDRFNIELQDEDMIFEQFNTIEKVIMIVGKYV